MIQKINYNHKIYYKEESTGVIYNSNKKILSNEDAKANYFLNKEEFEFFLEKLFNKPKEAFLNEKEFRQILTSNFDNGSYPLIYENTLELLKGVNYKIIKNTDLNALLDILEKIKQKHPSLIYKEITYDLGRNVSLKDVNAGNKKFFKAPFGNISKTSVTGIPLILDHQIRILESL